MPNVGIQSEVSEAGGEEGACASEAPRGGGVLARARERAGKNQARRAEKTPDTRGGEPPISRERPHVCANTPT